MASVTDLSDLIYALTGGYATAQQIYASKNGRVGGAAATAPIANRLHSLWTYDGLTGPGTAPTTSAIPDNTTAGGLLQTDPSGGRELWCTGGIVSANNVSGTLIVYDRLVHQGGLSGTSTSAQTTNLPTTALTRYTDGKGNLVLVEIYTIVGTTATTVTVTYKDAGGTNRVSPTVAFGGTNDREVTRAFQMPHLAGINTVTTVESVTLAASTTTAGNFGVSIIHPLLEIPVGAAGIGGVRDLIGVSPGLVKIPTDACLGFLWFSTSTTPPEFCGHFNLLER